MDNHHHNPEENPLVSSQDVQAASRGCLAIFVVLGFIALVLIVFLIFQLFN